jgi:hypothetical protein
MQTDGCKRKPDFEACKETARRRWKENSIAIKRTKETETVRMFSTTGELDLGAEAEDALGPLRRALGRLVNRNKAGGLRDLAVRLKAVEKELMGMSEPQPGKFTSSSAKLRRPS